MRPIPLLTLLLLAAGASIRAQPVVLAEVNPAGPWVAPEEERARPAPPPATREQLFEGRRIYREHCAACHGEAGAGDGRARNFIQMTLPNLGDKAWAAERTDAEWHWKIKTGRLPMMPYQGFLSDAQIWNTVGYIRTFSADAPFNDAEPTPAPVAAAKPAADDSGGGNASKGMAGLLAVVGILAAGAIFWALAGRGQKRQE